MRLRNDQAAVALLLLATSLTACVPSVAGPGDRPYPLATARPDSDYDRLPEAPLEPDQEALTRAPEPVPARHIVEPVRAGTVSDDHVVLGNPYAIAGKTFTPADPPRSDEVGYAAVLPAESGGLTASGESYNPSAMAAAHRTLPMPSYVEVTSVETGKTILVRINDRGPMLADRVIALSPAAASSLGIAPDGTSGVRVRRVNPIEQERGVLRNGGQVAERLEAPAGFRTALVRMLPPKPKPLAGAIRTARAPTPVTRAPTSPAPATVPVPPSQAYGADYDLRAPADTSKPHWVTTGAQPTPAARPKRPPTATPAKPAAKAGGYVVQVAALSSAAKAQAMARSVGGFVTRHGALYRVRTGPYASEAAARAALASITAKGVAGGRVMANDGR